MKGDVMKIIFGILISGLAIATSRAQWIVYDPAAHTQQIIDEAENIAKYIEMINNQVQQINTLSSQLQQLQNYNQAFGNPASLLNITGVNGLVGDLARTPVGQTIEQVQGAAKGTEAMTFNAGGLYHSIGLTFTIPNGTKVQREETTYRDNAAVQRTVQNYTNVVDDVLNRRRTLKIDIAATTEKLQSATTASEVQKLTGVLIGLNADLAATDKEIDHATGLTLVQDAENRSDAEKQIKAQQEERAAEFTQSLKNYRTTFAPEISPPVFPEK
jgi:hypothetical protein